MRIEQVGFVHALVRCQAAQAHWAVILKKMKKTSINSHYGTLLGKQIFALSIVELHTV